jgi:hypothetical protein
MCEHKFYMPKHNHVHRNILHNDLFLIILIKLKYNFLVSCCLLLFFSVSLVENTQLSYKIYFLDASVYTNTSAVIAVDYLGPIRSLFLITQIHLDFNLSSFSLESFKLLDLGCILW